LVFDASYFDLCWRQALLYAKTAPPNMHYADADADASGDLLQLGTQTAVLLVCNTLISSRHRDRGAAANWDTDLKDVFRRNVPGCRWFMQQLLDARGELWQRCLALCA